MRALKNIVLAVSILFSQLVLAQASPVPMLEQVANSIIDTLKENKSSLSSNPDIIYRAVETHLLPKVDVEGMSRSVLGRQAWNKATPAERINFLKPLLVWLFELMPHL